MFMATLKRPYANHILFPTCSETTGQVSIVIYQKQKKKVINMPHARFWPLDGQGSQLQCESPMTLAP